MFTREAAQGKELNVIRGRIGKPCGPVMCASGEHDKEMAIEACGCVGRLLCTPSSAGSVGHCEKRGGAFSLSKENDTYVSFIHIYSSSYVSFIHIYSSSYVSFIHIYSSSYVSFIHTSIFFFLRILHSY